MLMGGGGEGEGQCQVGLIVDIWGANVKERVSRFYIPEVDISEVGDETYAKFLV